MNNETQDDKVLARLYKEGTKETSPKELDEKILNYAAENKKPSLGGSLFAGDWKVPVSMAASVVLVFALLVQLDQQPNQTEIPPLPRTEKFDESYKQTFENATDSDTMLEVEELTGRSESRVTQSLSEDEYRSKKESAKPERIVNKKLESGEQQEIMRQNNEMSKQKALKNIPVESEASAPKSSVSSKQEAALENDQERKRALSDDAQLEKDVSRSIVIERQDQPSIAVDSEFAPLPVEDWLLKIEQLLARKDYAEARRQIEKFKQAHPKVNVEELESKIP